MNKEIKMELTTVLNVFRDARVEFVSAYIAELESDKLSIPETIFALKKLSEYCERNDGWDFEKQQISEIIRRINFEAQCAEERAKEEAPANRFWTAFIEWMHTELPAADLLYPQYVDYDNWNGGTYYLSIDFESVSRRYWGTPYAKQYDDRDHCNLSDIKSLIELLYRELIQVNARYSYTVQVNKMLSQFSMPYELKNGRVIKKGYKTSNQYNRIINFRMFESKIQWSEERILGTDVLDKHTALNYITDALQYLLSLIKALPDEELLNKNLKQRCALIVSNDVNSKMYAAISYEISEVQKIANEYFDIRHNEYVSESSKTEREPLKDGVFIEYLYNRIYGLLFFLKSKYQSYLEINPRECDSMRESNLDNSIDDSSLPF